MDKMDNTFQTKDITFSNSKDVPFQRWYPYIEGYSPSFVTKIINKYCPTASLVYEPFAGTGTTIYAADAEGVDTVYSEINPLLRFLIDVKTKVLRLNDNERKILSLALREEGESILKKINRFKPSLRLQKTYSASFGNSVYFPQEQFQSVLKLRSYIDTLKRKNALLADLVSIAVFSCLLPVSYLKKQGDVRFKTEEEKQKEMKTLEEVLPQKLIEMSEDISNQFLHFKKEHQLIVENAKEIGQVEVGRKISAVITSPPYLNGTNYFRNTKLELWFLEYLKDSTDLRMFRDLALTSGINDVKAEYQQTEVPFKSDTFAKTMNELQTHAYDRRIPLMAKCYFCEMHKLFYGLRKHLERGADIMIDLGDSIFSGVHIKTDFILTDILQGLGYSFKDRIVLRQRRSRNGALLSQVLLVYKFEQDEHNN